jgi:hypothetical protein
LRKYELSIIGRRTHWILELEQYNFEVIYQNGKKIAHVDALSRNFQKDQEASVVSGLL